MADKKDEDGGESAGGRGLSLITGLDLIMVATARRGAARRGGRIGRFSHGGRIERGDR